MSLVDLFLDRFEETMKRNLIHFEDIFPLINDSFMRMVHEILNYTVKGKEICFYGSIHVTN